MLSHGVTKSIYVRRPQTCPVAKLASHVHAPHGIDQSHSCQVWGGEEARVHGPVMEQPSIQHACEFDRFFLGLRTADGHVALQCAVASFGFTAKVPVDTERSRCVTKHARRLYFSIVSSPGLSCTTRCMHSSRRVPSQALQPSPPTSSPSRTRPFRTVCRICRQPHSVGCNLAPAAVIGGLSQDPLPSWLPGPCL